MIKYDFGKYFCFLVAGHWTWTEIGQFQWSESDGKGGSCRKCIQSNRWNYPLMFVR